MVCGYNREIANLELAQIDAARSIEIRRNLQNNNPVAHLTIWPKRDCSSYKSALAEKGPMACEQLDVQPSRIAAAKLIAWRPLAWSGGWKLLIRP